MKKYRFHIMYDDPNLPEISTTGANIDVTTDIYINSIELFQLALNQFEIYYGYYKIIYIMLLGEIIQMERIE